MQRIVRTRPIALALFASAVAAIAQAGDATIALHPQAEPHGARYTLGEIADIRSPDARLTRRLAAAEVGLTPRIGQTQSVPRDSIAQRLERSRPQWRGRIDWQGAQAVVVAGRGEPLDVQAMHSLAERTLIEALEQRGLRAEVQPVKPLDDLTLPVGARRLHARLSEGWTPSRRVCVWIDIEIDGRGYRSVPLWFAVKAHRQVLVARESLPAGMPLRPEDFEPAWFDVATLASPALEPQAPLDDRRLRQALAAGRPLLASAVEARPAVVRNEPVEVQVAVGAIRLSMSAIALRDARIGERVTVRSQTSKEPFGALVVADRTVRVETR